MRTSYSSHACRNIEQHHDVILNNLQRLVVNSKNIADFTSSSASATLHFPIGFSLTKLFSVFL